MSKFHSYYHCVLYWTILFFGQVKITLPLNTNKETLEEGGGPQQTPGHKPSAKKKKQNGKWANEWVQSHIFLVI